jgi:hypothetical protein
MDTEAIRQKFRPDKIKLLLVGESPPANGKFFYVKSAMTTFTSRAFEKAHSVRFGQTSDFLDYFKACGCFLDDIVHFPIDQFPYREREKRLSENVDSLSQRIKTADPFLVVVVLIKIEKYVVEAVGKSTLDPKVRVLPFPGCGHQSKYIAGLASIVGEYISFPIRLV